MERTNVKYEHNFLKILSFIIAYVFLIGTAMLTSYGINDDTSVYREVLQGTGIELLSICILILIYMLVIRRIFPFSADYEVTYTNKKVIISFFLICPFLVFLYANILRGDVNNIYQPVVRTSWNEVLHNIMFFPVAAILGPLLEELCCRVMCISVFRSRAGKIIALISTTMVFALCHGADFLIHIPSGLIYGIIMICTHNIIIPILLHMAWNTATFIVPTVSDSLALLMRQDIEGIWGSPIIAVIVFGIAFVIGVVLLLKNIKRRTT